MNEFNVGSLNILTGFTIKIIAVLAMIIDHTGAVFDLHSGYRVVGRLAFPLFAFLIAEGYKHTTNIRKYLLRLGLFAFISEIPYDLAFNQVQGYPMTVDFLNGTNIFYTLFLGLLCAFLLDRAREKILGTAGELELRTGDRIVRPTNLVMINLVILLALVIISVAGMSAADWIGSDYGGLGVLFIFLMAAFNQSKTLNLCIVAFFMFWLYFPQFDMLTGAFLALPIMAFASGEQGKPVKWIFYFVYPGHLLLLYFFALML